jgi:hypothetical protein
MPSPVGLHIMVRHGYRNQLPTKGKWQACPIAFNLSFRVGRPAIGNIFSKAHLRVDCILPVVPSCMADTRKQKVLNRRRVCNRVPPKTTPLTATTDEAEVLCSCAPMPTKRGRLPDTATTYQKKKKALVQPGYTPCNLAAEIPITATPFNYDPSPSL